MNSKALYLFTRTPLHIGAGSSVGAIDQPVQRERHTGHPIIPGSSIKGVLRDAARQNPDINDDEIDDSFGPEDSTEPNSEKITRAGNISFAEGRILAFPVRSAAGAFAYITCPFSLLRFQRERNLTDLPDLPSPDEQECFAQNGVVLRGKNSVVLEEYCFTQKGVLSKEWLEALKGLIDDPVWQSVTERLVLLTDGDFAHFVKSATEISNHNRISAETGSVEEGALFNLESVPAETLFMATVHSIGRPAAKVKKTADSEAREIYQTDSEKILTDLIESHPLLQFGGFSTTGCGFCSLSLS